MNTKDNQDPRRLSKARLKHTSTCLLLGELWYVNEDRRQVAFHIHELPP